ncbi:MAG: tyrosine-protein phosphatase [Verrucomicrobiota bacterium]
MTPQHYTIEEGRLDGGEYPGSKTTDEARARLRSLITIGVRTFLDLTTPADQMEPYEELLPGLEREAGIPLRRISLPIPDMCIPSSVDTMREIMTAIRESIERAPAVYVHCWGGIGRTGMVVGCWLRELGYDPDAALKHVQHLYSSQMPKFWIHPESPQTNEQRDYVRRWEVQP